MAWCRICWSNHMVNKREKTRYYIVSVDNGQKDSRGHTIYEKQQRAQTYDVTECTNCGNEILDFVLSNNITDEASYAASIRGTCESLRSELERAEARSMVTAFFFSFLMCLTVLGLFIQGPFAKLRNQLKTLRSLLGIYQQLLRECEEKIARGSGEAKTAA